MKKFVLGIFFGVLISFVILLPSFPQSLNNNSFVINQFNYVKDKLFLRQENTKEETKDNNIEQNELQNSNQSSTIKEKQFQIKNIQIGDSEQKVLINLGQPLSKELSEYGFYWYVYHNNYKDYVQVGIKDSKVVGLYTNSTYWSSKKNLHINSTKVEVNKELGNPLEYIQKGNTQYILNNDKNQLETYLVDDSYITIFYDIHKNNVISAIQLIEKNTELALNQFYGEPSEELRISFEKQIFNLTNSVRVRENKSIFIWNDDVAQIAREHSKDMAIKNYFDHLDLQGKSAVDRFKAKKIKYTIIGENIAQGQTNAIYAHESWMNSLGHRENILGKTKFLGVGVFFGGNYNTYYTQNFYTPRT